MNLSDKGSPNGIDQNLFGFSTVWFHKSSNDFGLARAEYKIIIDEQVIFVQR